MNLFKKVASGALALTFAAGMTGGVMAQVPPAPINDNGDVVVEVTEKEVGGVLSVAISALTDLGEYEYLLAPQETNTGSLTITAADLRGTAGGWTVTLSGTDFAAGTFPIGNLGLTAQIGGVSTESTTLHPSEAAPIAASAAPVLVAPGTTVLSVVATTGAGEYESDYDVDLTIPAGTLVGIYDSTLTVTITGAGPTGPTGPTGPAD